MQFTARENIGGLLLGVSSARGRVEKECRSFAKLCKEMGDANIAADTKSSIDLGTRLESRGSLRL